jgi:hypothetical protein
MPEVPLSYHKKGPKASVLLQKFLVSY